jgi:hypothetical protein
VRVVGWASALVDTSPLGETPQHGATAPSRLAVVIGLSVMSDAAGMVPTGGELTLFEAVGPTGLTSFCCVARRWSGMSGVT